MEQTQSVPFLDLNSQIEAIRGDLFQEIEKTIDASDFILGPRLDAFEAAFASYCDAAHAIGVSSGTDALFLALRALGVGVGDEVITVPNVFIAAVEAIVRVGAVPVLVDVDEGTFCIDPEAVERAITPRTKAVIPIHLFGQPCDMDRLMVIAENNGIFVIEDACQAHGAMLNGKPVGSLGHAAAFSFYPTKNLGAFGDGGAVTTNDPDIADKIRMLRHHAQPARNTHSELGYNSRLDSIQAAVLKIKLPHLDRWNAQRRTLADRFRAKLEGSDYTFQSVSPGSVPVYHVLAARHPRRELVHEQLDQHRIGYGRHIAMPIHEQPGYRYLGYEKGSLPVSERLCDELVSLPIFPTLSSAQADYIVDALAKVVVSV